MSWYIKKPIPINAWEIKGDDSGTPQWVSEAKQDGIFGYDGFDEECDADRYYVETLGGCCKCHEGDFLVKGIHSELYPCKRDIFLETHIPYEQ